MKRAVVVGLSILFLSMNNNIDVKLMHLARGVQTKG